MHRVAVANAIAHPNAWKSRLEAQNRHEQGQIHTFDCFLKESERDVVVCEAVDLSC